MSEKVAPPPVAAAKSAEQAEERAAGPVLPDWKPYPRAGRNLLYYFIGNLLRLVFRFYTHWQVIGLENVPPKGGVLLASNHASYLDPMLIGAALYGYRPPWLMGKSDMWQNRMLGYVNDRVKGFPVRRNAPDRAALRRVLDWLAQGEAVAMFPEGERTRTGKLNPAQPGITLLIQKSGVPVVPVACLGTYEMWPTNRKSIRRTPLKIVFGKPMTFPPEASREQVTTAIMAAIAALMTAHGCPMEPPQTTAPREGE